MKNEVNLDNAGLGRALLVSLALHALVLWQVLVNVDDWRAQSPQASEGNVMNARLHGSAVSQQSVSTPLLPVSAQAGSPHPVKRSRMNVPRDVRPPAGTIAPPPPLALASAANTLTVATTSMVSDGIDGEGLRRYRVGLAAAARQFRSYPAQAKGWQGSVEIRLTIATDGSALPLQLLHGSGAELLDTAALDMISGAARSTDLPGVLRGKTFSMDMLLEFLPEEDSVR